MKRFDENAIDWAQAARRGLSRSMLKEHGLLDILLSGGTTPCIPLRLTLDNMVIYMDASLSLEEDETGLVGFVVTGPDWQ